MVTVYLWLPATFSFWETYTSGRIVVMFGVLGLLADCNVWRRSFVQAHVMAGTGEYGGDGLRYRHVGHRIPSHH